MRGRASASREGNCVGNDDGERLGLDAEVDGRWCRRRREMVEADAESANRAVQRGRRGGRFVLMGRVRNGIQAEYEREADEQCSRPAVQQSDLMEEAHDAGRRLGLLTG